MMFCFGGPLVMAVIYFIHGNIFPAQTVTMSQVALNITSVTLMAFVAAGITAIYTSDRLPIISALLIHGAVLYADYLIIYLINGWLQRSAQPIIIFTAAFVSGYAVIWLCIWLFTKKSVRDITDKIRSE